MIWGYHESCKVSLKNIGILRRNAEKKEREECNLTIATTINVILIINNNEIVMYYMVLFLANMVLCYKMTKEQEQEIYLIREIHAKFEIWDVYGMK